MSIAAGIVTYNPDLRRFAHCLDAIVGQVTAVLVFDNASANVDDIEGIVRLHSNARLLRNVKNAGMAVALNRLAALALKEHFNALLILDQDSIVNETLVAHEARLLHGNVALVGPLVMDRSNLNRSLISDKALSVDSIINSGALLSLSIWSALGGYDERLFVDLVDYEYCLHLRSQGYDIVQDCSSFILHQLGEGKICGYIPVVMNWKVKFQAIYISSHSASRQRDLARSYTIIRRKYRNKGVSCCKYFVKLRFTPVYARFILVSLLMRPHRIEFIRACLQGWREGKDVAIEVSQRGE